MVWWIIWAHSVEQLWLPSRRLLKMSFLLLHSFHLHKWWECLKKSSQKAFDNYLKWFLPLQITFEHWFYWLHFSYQEQALEGRLEEKGKNLKKEKIYLLLSYNQINQTDNKNSLSSKRFPSKLLFLFVFLFYTGSSHTL